MVAFSYRSFKNHLNSEITPQETRFLIRTFGYASIYFAFVGVAVFVLYVLLSEVLGLKGWVSSLVFSLIGFLICLPLHFFSIRYRNNPLRLPSSFVSACFLLLTTSFIFVFLGITGVLFEIISVGQYAIADDGRKIVGLAIMAVMGTSALIYSIPAVFAWFVKNNRKATVKLNRFLNTCYVTYLFVFAISIVAFCLGFGIQKAWQIIVLILLSACIFCGPALTIYRLKTVAYYINHDDDYERKRWENYFAFEISFQLLKIAFCVLKILILCLMRKRTRLR